jgi:hypothetical protein
MNRRDVTKAIAYVLLMCSSSTGFARLKVPGRPTGGGGVARGTINIVMGNDNGLVVLTDSMLTETGPNGVQRQIQTPGQKLFRLDSRSVLTIAGFTAAPIPFPEVEHAMSAILARYKSQLASTENSYRPNIREKLAQLDFILEHELSLLADIRNNPEEYSQYTLCLTVAGYDADGKARIAWSTLRIDPSLKPDWLAAVQETGERVITGRKTTILVRGITRIANDAIDHPEKYSAEKAIARYRLAEAGRKPLTIKEMKGFAASLARITAARYPGVGGPNQVAVLQRGGITEFAQPIFPPEIPRAVGLDIAADNIFVEQEIGPSQSRTSLYIHNSFSDCTVLLDGSYFAANDFKHSQVVYRGGHTIFAPNQDVSTSTLIFAKSADQGSETASNLIHHFHWASVTTEETPESPAQP